MAKGDTSCDGKVIILLDEFSLVFLGIPGYILSVLGLWQFIKQKPIHPAFWPRHNKLRLAITHHNILLAFDPPRDMLGNTKAAAVVARNGILLFNREISWLELVAPVSHKRSHLTVDAICTHNECTGVDRAICSRDIDTSINEIYIADPFVEQYPIFVLDRVV